MNITLYFLDVIAQVLDVAEIQRANCWKRKEEIGIHPQSRHQIIV